MNSLRRTSQSTDQMGQWTNNTAQTWNQLQPPVSLPCWEHSRLGNWSSWAPDQSPQPQIKSNSEERCFNLPFILCTYQPSNLHQAPGCLCTGSTVRLSRFNVLSEGCDSAHYNTLFLSAVARWQLLLQIPRNVKFKLCTSTCKAKLSSTPSFKRGRTILNFTSLANCSDCISITQAELRVSQKEMLI